VPWTAKSVAWLDALSRPTRDTTGLLYDRGKFCSHGPVRAGLPAAAIHASGQRIANFACCEIRFATSSAAA